MADQALDYTFPSQNVVRLVGTLFKGWKSSRYGQFFLGVCTFDWRGGSRFRAEMRYYPSDRATTLEQLEEVEWLCDGADDQTRWRCDSGKLRVDVPILLSTGAASPLLEDTGLHEGRMAQTVYVNQGPGRGHAEVKLLLTFDRDRREWVEWIRSGMASAGLPSLGKRR